MTKFFFQSCSIYVQSEEVKAHRIDDVLKLYEEHDGVTYYCVIVPKSLSVSQDPFLHDPVDIQDRAHSFFVHDRLEFSSLLFFRC